MVYDGVILLGLLMLASAIALPIGDPHKAAFRDFWFTAWLFFVCFVYLGACWRYAGMTLGMRAWRLRLISADGDVISWPRCLLRFLIGAVSVAFFGLGILWSLLDRQQRGWHDLAAGTQLIRLNKEKR